MSESQTRIWAPRWDGCQASATPLSGGLPFSGTAEQVREYLSHNTFRSFTVTAIDPDGAETLLPPELAL